jgi:hypothetical protein
MAGPKLALPFFCCVYSFPKSKTSKAYDTKRTIQKPPIHNYLALYKMGFSIVPMVVVTFTCKVHDQHIAES